MSFESPRTIQEAYTIISNHNSTISKIQNHVDNSFQISKGVVKSVSSDMMSYEVEMPREKVVIKDAVLFLDKGYYQIVGFPNVGDVVKVFHQSGFTTAFVVARVNSQLKELVMDKNSSIPKGSNVP